MMSYTVLMFKRDVLHCVTVLPVHDVLHCQLEALYKSTAKACTMMAAGHFQDESEAARDSSAAHVE